MKSNEFIQELNLKYKPVSVTLTDNCHDNYEQDFEQCILTALKAATGGKNVVIHNDMLKCRGASTGCGFRDGVPNTPGGFGNFISIGAGEGFPLGERLKKSPEIAEKMIINQPQDVLQGHKFITLKPYEDDVKSDVVILFANSDQLAALTFLFNFNNGEYDTVIAPAVSGCASVFRIPFGELKTKTPRAVIGNLDIFSRPHFDKDVVSFTASYDDYIKMLANADECFFKTRAWKRIKERL
ncbi:MAG: DUF169 domain-containing protein [Oscillospiraceae bacterium]